jgi:multidrug efflux pump subunit AcrA (membrane-fusion protein)
MFRGEGGVDRSRVNASFRLPGYERAVPSNRLVSIGSVIDPQSRTVPIIFEVSNRDGTIKVGSTATADLMTNRREQGVVIPSSAILDEDGRAIAYVQAEGERFEKRDLVLGGSERGLTLVRSGIKEGERVVTGAAYQVRLASLSTAVPAHGHEH